MTSEFYEWRFEIDTQVIITTGKCRGLGRISNQYQEDVVCTKSWKKRYHQNSRIPSRLRQLSLLGTTLLRGKSASLLSLLDLLDDGILKTLRLGNRSPARDDLSVSGDQELLEVPLHALEAHQTGLLLLHECPDGSGIVTVHIEFAEDGE